MIKLLKYIFTFLMPWVSMFAIEENVAAVVTFFLQLSLVGWIPGSIWACHLLGKHLKKKQQQKTSQAENEKNANPPKN